MKKNFFKKLSFVLALAMIVTALAPASGVFAAAKAPKLNSSSKYLHLDVEDKNEFDFNISNKQSGWKYLWSSANEDVVDVNAKNGVAVATGAGKTTVSVVISDKDGEEVDELKATVTVRDNIKELTITNTPAEDKLAVGASNDFNRSYVTVAGNKKGSKAITRWTVTDKDGKEVTTATISDAGVFVATAAGEYTITANAFQSKAKYTSWLNDAAKYASYVTATTFTKVTVAASMTEVEQVDLDTLKVTFDSAVTDAATKLSVFNVIGTAEVSTVISKVTMNDTNTEAVVDLFVPFIEEGTVVVKYPNMVDVKFVAASSKVTEVKTIEIVTTTAKLQTPTDIVVKFINSNNVNIVNADLYARLTWETSNLSSTVDTTTTPPELMLFKVGDTTNLTATFHTYNYDTTTGQETGNLVAKMPVTCIDKTSENKGTLSAYSVDTAVDWKELAHSVAADDVNLFLFVKLEGTDTSGNKLETLNINGATPDAEFTYTSSDVNVAYVGDDARVYANKAGSTVVVVKYDGKIVGTCPITVTAKRKLAIFTLSTQNIVLSNDDDVVDLKSVTMSAKDQLEGSYDGYTVGTSLTSSGTDTGLRTSVDNAGTITFNAANVPAGTYYYTVKLTDDNDDKVNFSKLISVTVKAPSDDNAVYYYALETDESTYDMKIASSDDAAGAGENVTISLFGYASNGVRNKRIDIAGDLVTVTAPNNSTTYAVSGGGLVPSNKDATLSLVTVAAPVDKLATGTYKIRAVSGTEINTAAYFVVSDTQSKPVLNVNKTYSKASDSATLLDAINECFDFKVDGTDIPVALLTDVTHSTDVNGIVFIKQVVIKQVFANSASTVEFTVPVNITIDWNN